MKYQLVKEVLDLVENFDTKDNLKKYGNSAEGFKNWILEENQYRSIEQDWEGKTDGRTPESIISTLIVHMNRFAKNYSKSAIYQSKFSTQDEFIYLIILNSFGEMSKMELIKKNMHDKPAGIQIINRLIKQGWVSQIDSNYDKRSKLISITPYGLETLNLQMNNIRKATQIVSGNLSLDEKLHLIKLLSKLENFHKPIYLSEEQSETLLDKVYSKYF